MNLNDTIYENAVENIDFDEDNTQQVKIYRGVEYLSVEKSEKVTRHGIYRGIEYDIE